MGPLPQVVALEHAIQLLSLLTKTADTEASRRKIQSCRNQSYLEHGYDRVGEKAGRGILIQADELVNRILWTARLDESRKLKMIF